jgi:hypothetical protein
MGIGLDGYFSAIFHIQLCEGSFARNDGVAFVDLKALGSASLLLAFFDNYYVASDKLKAACCGKHGLRQSQH